MSRSKLTMPKIAHNRSTYAERTRQNSRATKSLLAAVNGRGDQHWSHDDIRTALLRRHVVELDELLEELPRAAISYAIAKGWIHKAAGEAWFRVTKRAAAELQLPTRHNGAKIHFIDASKLPKSLPAFEEAKQTPKPVVSDERAAAILAALREPRDVLAQARLYQAVMSETGWVAIEIARRLESDPAEISRRWDDVIHHIDLLALETEYQNAVASGQLSLPDAYELFRVPAAHRAELFAALQAGKGRSAVRKLAGQLLKSAN
jgi:hypothetical protein